MTTTRRPPTPCPYCSKESDAATPAGGTEDDATPEAGAVSVCFFCGGIALFTETGLRKPNDAERVELLADPRVIEAAGAVLAYRSEHG